VKCHFQKIVLFTNQIKGLSAPHTSFSNAVRSLPLRPAPEFQINNVNSLQSPG